MIEADTTTEQENYCFIKDIRVLQTYCGFYNDASFFHYSYFSHHYSLVHHFYITLINIFSRCPRLLAPLVSV